MENKAYSNFIRHLNWSEIPARQRVLAAFVLTAIMDGYRPGQEACLHHLLAVECCKLLESADEVRFRFRVIHCCRKCVFDSYNTYLAPGTVDSFLLLV